MRAAYIMSDCPNLCKDGSTELKKQKIGATDLLQIQQILPFPCLEKLGLKPNKELVLQFAVIQHDAICCQAHLT
jgi:hypothetical protein